MNIKDRRSHRNPCLSRSSVFPCLVFPLPAASFPATPPVSSGFLFSCDFTACPWRSTRVAAEGSVVRYEGATSAARRLTTAPLRPRDTAATTKRRNVAMVGCPSSWTFLPRPSPGAPRFSSLPSSRSGWRLPRLHDKNLLPAKQEQFPSLDKNAVSCLNAGCAQDGTHFSCIDGELYQLLTKKTYTRSEFDRITQILCLRVTEPSTPEMTIIGDKEMRKVPNKIDNQNLCAVDSTVQPASSDGKKNKAIATAEARSACGLHRNDATQAVLLALLHTACILLHRCDGCAGFLLKIYVCLHE